MAPLDTLRTRLQAGKFATAREALVGTLRHEGFLALYKGMSMPLAAQAVYKAVLFSGFGFSSRMLASVEARLPVLTWFACGSFAGLCNSICVCVRFSLSRCVALRVAFERKNKALTT